MWTSFAGRLDVQAAEKRVQSAEKRRYAAYTQLLPTLALNGQLSRQANYRGEEDAEWNTLDAWSAGGSVNLVLFQGGNKWAALESANAALVIAEQTLERRHVYKQNKSPSNIILGKTTAGDTATGICTVDNRRTSLSRSDAPVSKGV